MAVSAAPEPRAAAADHIEIGPQPGPQSLFLETPADIAIIGGSVFGGKTWALTFEALRNVAVEGFTFVGFRRVTPSIKNPGGWWDETLGLFPLLDGDPRPSVLEWKFPSGAHGKLAGLQYDADVLDWKSAQICLLLFDQLEEFTEAQFWYMFSRNRSTCGVRPYIRASCNPDPDSFLRPLLSWWIDDASGYALPERSGVIRWFVRLNDQLEYSTVTCGQPDYARYDELEIAAKADLVQRFGENGKFAKSITFILARLQDNAIGNEKDPEYEANVRAMSHVEAERLLGGDRGGNWNIRAAAGLVFNTGWFEIVDELPTKRRVVRFWDKASLHGRGDFTSGVKMSEADGIYYVEHDEFGQWNPGERESTMRTTAELDGKLCRIGLEQEPGSGGKESAEASIKNLRGFNVQAFPATGNKLERANPFAAQAKAGNVKLLRGPWNARYLRILHAFPTKGIPDDDVDASSGAFDLLTGKGRGILDYYAKLAERQAAEKATTAAASPMGGATHVVSTEET